jgi:hypothetical protein
MFGVTTVFQVVEHDDAVSHTSHPSQKSFIPMLYIGDADRLEALMLNGVSLDCGVSSPPLMKAVSRQPPVNFDGPNRP